MQKEGASLVAQLVKNLPAMQETLVQSLGWEDPLYSCLENPHGQTSLVGYSHGVTKSQTQLSTCRKRKVKDHRKVLSLSNWKDGVAINGGG